MPRKNNFFSGDYDIKEGYFFGFHDVTPFSHDETKVLACKYSFDLRMPKAGEGVEVDTLILKMERWGISISWQQYMLGTGIRDADCNG